MLVMILASAAAIVWPGSAPPRAEISRSQEVRAKAFKLLNDGIQAYKEGRPKDAIPLLRQASDIALSSYRAYYYLGLALKADRQYQKAIAPLQIAIELDPLNHQAHVALGDCYLQQGDPAEALAEYHRVLAAQDDYAPAWDGLGRAAEASGDIEKAVESYRRAIELNPGFPDSSINLGDLLMREGRFNEAIDLFVRAIKVRPDFAAAYNRLGAAYARQRLGNEAIAALRQAELLEKGNAWHPVTIGGIFLEMDNLVQARREFDAALMLDPDYLEGYLVKAALLRREGRLTEAIEALDAGSARPVDDERLKARLKAKKDQIQNEARLLAEARARVEADPSSPAALVTLAKLRAEQGDHAAAAELLKKAIGLHGGDGPDPDLLGLLAYSALRAGLHADAASAYEALSHLKPDDAATFINLGLARTGLGDYAGAEAALRDANRLLPGDARPLAYLGNVYVLEGEHDKAIESLQAAQVLSGEAGEDRQRIERLLRALQAGKAGS